MLEDAMRRVVIFNCFIIAIGLIALITGVRDGDMTDVALGGLIIVCALALFGMMVHRHMRSGNTLSPEAEKKLLQARQQSAASKVLLVVLGALLCVTLAAVLIDSLAHPDLSWWSAFRRGSFIALQVSVVVYGASRLFDRRAGRGEKGE